VHLAWQSRGRVAIRQRTYTAAWQPDLRPDDPDTRRRVFADSVERLAYGIRLSG
jgi:hypothetical protein